MKYKFTLFWGCIALIFLLTSCNTSSITNNEEVTDQEESPPNVKEVEEPKEVEKEEVTTLPQEEWSEEKAKGVIENNYSLLSNILTVHQTEYFKKAEPNIPYQDFINMKQIKEDLSVIGSPEWLDSSDLEKWVDAYMCQCDAYGILRPYPLDIRFTIGEQNEDFITVSSIDLQNEMGYGGGTWSITIDKKEEKFHVITYEKSEDYPLNLIPEEVIAYYQAVFQTSLTFLEEKEIEGTTWLIFKGNNSHSAINTQTSVHDWQVAALYDEPTENEEESEHEFTEHGVAAADSIILDISNPSTFIGTWMDSTDYSGMVSSLMINKHGDVYEINLLEHSPGAYFINGADGEVTFVEGKASFEFLEDANGNSGRIDIELTTEGVIYRKTMASNLAGWFNQDSEVLLGLKVID